MAGYSDSDKEKILALVPALERAIRQFSEELKDYDEPTSLINRIADVTNTPIDTVRAWYTGIATPTPEARAEMLRLGLTPPDIA